MVDLVSPFVNLRARLVRAHPRIGTLFRLRTVSNLVQLVVFLVKHRRIPSFEKSGYLNDLLFRIRARDSQIVLRSFTSDKEFVKIYVRGLIGEDITVPTLGIIRDVEAIDAYVFPANCVIKPTDMSGEIIFSSDGNVTAGERMRMKRWMTTNYGEITGERNYSRLEPKIIIEPWLRVNGDACHDWQVHVFHGKATLVDVGLRQSDGSKRWGTFTAQGWIFLPHVTKGQEHLNREELAQFPPTGSDPIFVRRMVNVAEALGGLFEYSRVDFYSNCSDRIWVGEITHVAAGAGDRLEPVEMERVYLSGDVDDLRRKSAK